MQLWTGNANSRHTDILIFIIYLLNSYVRLFNLAEMQVLGFYNIGGYEWNYQNPGEDRIYLGQDKILTSYFVFISAVLQAIKPALRSQVNETEE